MGAKRIAEYLWPSGRTLCTASDGGTLEHPWCAPLERVAHALCAAARRSIQEITKTYAVINTVFVFKLPPRTGAAAYSAKQWGDPIWQGKLRLVGRGDKGLILLEHADKEGIFAKSFVNATTKLEGTADSSRYFVLRVTGDDGRHAFIGIGFSDRSEAFDLKSGLQRFQNLVKAERDAKEGGESTGPKLDLSLKKDQMIRINLTKDKLKPKKKGKDDAKEKRKKVKKSKKKKEQVPDDWVTF